jgi:hypothetical protein
MNARLLMLSCAVAASCHLGCASSDPNGPGPEPYPVDLPVPANGVQVRSLGREIAPGADEEWCEVVEIPGAATDTYFVARTEIAMAPFGHHLVISMAPEGSTALDRASLGEPAICLGAHKFGTGLVTLAASARPYSTNELPAGVGHVLRGGQRLVFDYHSFNTSDQPVRAAHSLNLHTVERIEKRARLFGFYNQYIEIPPHSTKSFADECFFSDTVFLWALARHTHRQGTDFKVWWAGGERDGEHVWTSTDWERDIDFTFDEPMVVSPGTGFRWECSFQNTTDQPLAFGPEATDEMCILFGQFAAVSEDDVVTPQSCYRFTP